MNIPDLVIWILIAASMLCAAYEGFSAAILNLAAYFVSLISALIFSPLLARSLFLNTTLPKLLLYYTEDPLRIDTVEHARAAISTFSTDQLAEIVNKANLPNPFDRLLLSNMENHVFDSLQQYTVSDYFNSTIVQVMIHMISLVVVFAGVYLVLSFLISGLNYTIQYPVLRRCDSLAACAVGLVRGGLLCFVVISLLPIALAVLPSVDLINDQIQGSHYLSFFLDGNFLLRFIRGYI